MKALTERLFGLVMFWTVATTLFTLLPLARIVGRAEGYEWAVLGLSGSGVTGPFLVFVPALLYALVLLWSAHRAPRGVFRPMLILWHVAVTAIVATVALSNGGSTIQGQGLRWEVPGWIVAIPCAAFTVLAIVWALRDRREDGRPTRVPWSRGNTRRLIGSVAILLVAVLLFRAGNNYNWVTALAIVATIGHWMLLARSFEPIRARSLPVAGGGGGQNQNLPTTRA